MPLRYEVVLRPRAIAFLDGASDEDKREILRLIEHIRLEPVPNEKTRITLSVPPAILTVLAQSGFWIAYHVSGSRVAIINIGTDSEGPPRYR